MELIRELCSIEGRGPGTDAERRAANMLAGGCAAIGREVAARADLRPPPVRAGPRAARRGRDRRQRAGHRRARDRLRAWSCSRPPPCTWTSTPASTWRARSSSAAPPRTSSPPAPPRRPAAAVLVAHYDAARSGFVFGERGLRLARRLSERGRLLLGPWRLIFWGGIAPLLPILGARMAGFEPGWLSILQLFPTVLLIAHRLPAARHRPLRDRPRRLRQRLGRRRRALGRRASCSDEPPAEPRRLGRAHRRRGVPGRGHALLRPRATASSSTASAPSSSTSTPSPTAAPTT